jgi:hypothetical protein
VKGKLRTRAPDYLAATDNYVANIGATIAKAQITNGGPVILLQPENEYSGGEFTPFPDPYYFAYVKQQYRNAGIVVPLINNDACKSLRARSLMSGILTHSGNQGLFAPGEVVNGTTVGDVNIYGHDSYPLGFNCAAPSVWPAGALPTYFHASHEQESPSTPYSLDEFQGGSFDPWGGLVRISLVDVLMGHARLIVFRTTINVQIFSIWNSNVSFTKTISLPGLLY